MRTEHTSWPWLLLLSLSACGESAPVVHRFGGPTMGSTYEVKYVGPMPMATVREVVEQELHAFDAAFSQWREDSEIARCNAHASTEPFAASPRFLDVLQQALELAAATGGAFDPTVKPLSDLYRAAKRDPAHRLDEQALAAAKARVGYRLVAVRDGAVHKARPDVMVDLDGLVAGACIDAIGKRLDALAVPAYYLEVTGEVFCRGEKAPALPWVIGVVDPAADVTGEVDTASEVPLRDRSLCTSGGYRNAFVADGSYVHHVFDPRSGRSADRGVVSVSVLARSAAVADALGTAFLVLGEEEVRRLLPTLDGYGEIGVLFLLAAAEGGLRQVGIGWPEVSR